MRRSGMISWVLATALLAALFGCSSNRDSDGLQTTTAEGQFGTNDAGVQFVGAATCIGCHKGISFSSAQVQGFLQSPHVIHDEHITAQSDQDECLICHDPQGDGVTIEGLIGEENVPAEGLAAVTCEDCHGAGGEHFGVGPIPMVNPDFNTCGKCHDALPQGEGHHEEGEEGDEGDENHHPDPTANNILTLFLASQDLDTGHAASFSGKNFPGRIEGTSMMAAICARCHTDEGFQELFALNTGFGAMTTELDNIAGFNEVSVVQCRTCHDPHFLELRGEGATLLDVDPDPALFDFREAYSAEFNLCTGCHQAFLLPDAATAPNFFVPAADPESEDTFTYELDFGIYGDEVDAAGNFIVDASLDTEVHNPATGALLNPADVGDRTITDTHFRLVDDQGTPDAADDVVLIPGYNINAADEQPCTVCHDPHASSKFPAAAATLAAQWGGSGHADYSAEPFIHAFSNPDCMKCHNGAEYAKFVAGEQEGDLNVSEGARVVACIACHDLQNRAADGSFALGPLRPVNEVTFPSGAVQSIPDGSNLCMECHQGRESGVSVENAIAETPGGPHSFINRHYFAAAAILFGNEVTAGFEYPGKTYMARNEFPGHTGNDRQTCTECHLRDAQGSLAHNFDMAPVMPFCGQCHSDAGTPAPPVGTLTSFDLLGLPFGAANVDYDGDGIGESFQGEINGFAGDGISQPEGALLTAIKNYAAANNLPAIGYLPTAYPYWFVDTDGNGLIEGDEGIGFGPNGNRYTAFDDQLLQAAYNFHSAQDPCGDIHNYRYVLQTLFDSVEDLSGAAAVAGFTRP